MDIVVVVMIEKKSAMQNLDEILSVEGVDMVQFGPSDTLSVSANRDRPGIRTSKTPKFEMVKRALKKGIQPRVEANDLERSQEIYRYGRAPYVHRHRPGDYRRVCKQQTKGGIASLLKSL